MVSLQQAIATLCLLFASVAADHLSGPQTCWTHLGTVGTCTSLGRCSSTNGFPVVLKSLRSNVCFWRRNKPFVCCPSTGGPFTTPPRDFLSPFFTSTPRLQPSRSDQAVTAPLPPPTPSSSLGSTVNVSPAAARTHPGNPQTRSQAGGSGRRRGEMKTEEMPTVEPFPMEEKVRRVLPPAGAEDAPQDLARVCGRADPVLLANAEEAELFRLLNLQTDPVLAVPGAAFGQEARVTGGATSVTGQWPWMVLIGQVTDSNTTWLCGGTIVDQFHVLTAAHCVMGRPNVVQFGDHNLESPPGVSTLERRQIAKITLHPGYRPPRAYHDIALVTLAQPAHFSRFVRPICLPPADIRLRRGQTAKITGHGYTEFNSGELSPRLQEARIKLQKRKLCNASYTQLGDIFFEKYPKGVLSHVLCAGNREGGVDACQGDSGGPLMQHSEEIGGYVQIGVISTGFGCGNPEFPGLYVSVKHHLNFIRAVMRSHPSRVVLPAVPADKPKPPSGVVAPTAPTDKPKPTSSAVGLKTTSRVIQTSQIPTRTTQAPGTESIAISYGESYRLNSAASYRAKPSPSSTIVRYTGMRTAAPVTAVRSVYSGPAGRDGSGGDVRPGSGVVAALLSRVAALRASRADPTPDVVPR